MKTHWILPILIFILYKGLFENPAQNTVTWWCFFPFYRHCKRLF